MTMTGIEHWQRGYRAGQKDGAKKGLNLGKKEGFKKGIKTMLVQLQDRELIEEAIRRGISVAMIHTNQVEVK